MWENVKYSKDMFGNVASINASKDNWHYCIPIDEQNPFYQEIMALVAEGKLVIEPAETPGV